MSDIKPNENNFIPSIYNYCDRWCERCDYTGQCRLFSVELNRKEKWPEGNNDITKELHKSFAETIKMIEEYSEKFGIDISPRKEIEEVEKKGPLAAQVSFITAKYFQESSAYLRKLKAEIKSSGKENAELAEIIPQNKGMNELLEILECYEIIQWYHTMLPVKLNRAVSSSETIPDSEAEEVEFSKRDRDGSAYVAYRSSIKSMAALGRIHSWTNTLKEETLNLIIDTGRIKNLIEKEFPGALTFFWPPEEKE